MYEILKEQIINTILKALIKYREFYKGIFINNKPWYLKMFAYVR